MTHPDLHFVLWIIESIANRKPYQKFYVGIPLEISSQIWIFINLHQRMHSAIFKELKEFLCLPILLLLRTFCNLKTDFTYLWTYICLTFFSFIYTSLNETNNKKKI